MKVQYSREFILENNCKMSTLSRTIFFFLIILSQGNIITTRTLSDFFFVLYVFYFFFFNEAILDISYEHNGSDKAYREEAKE